MTGQHGSGAAAHARSAAPAGPGQLAKAQPGAEQGQHVVPPEQRETGQQPPGLLRSQGASLGLTEDLLGIDPAPGWRHLADRVGVDRSLVHGELEDPQCQRPAVGPPLTARPPAPVVLASGARRPGSSCRSAGRRTVGAHAAAASFRRWQACLGLGSSAAHVSHHSAAQALNDSRPRWRPRQVPRRISNRFSAARSRASSGVSVEGSLSGRRVGDQGRLSGASCGDGPVWGSGVRRCRPRRGPNSAPRSPPTQ